MHRARSKSWVLIAIYSLLLAGCLERKLKPLNPCLVSVIADQVQIANVDQVDLLFMVDNSNSMRDEQAALRTQFGRLIKVLTTGDRDLDGREDFPPAKDLHLGVVSSDMGVVDIPEVPTCMGFGDDGILKHKPSPDLPNCATEYPPFLAFRAGQDAQRIADDFACIATLGTGGCGLEQQLEAPLKALWPAIDPMPVEGKNRITFVGNSLGEGKTGHGDMANVGFLRSGADGRVSLLAIVVVTDEEDCSTGRPDTFDTDPNGPLAKQDINLRCFHNPDKLYPLSRYIEGFKKLRPNHEQLVVFGAIVGVPQDSVEPEDQARVNREDPVQVDAFYQGILNDPRMKEQVDPNRGPEQSQRLLPACSNGASDAAPARRIVEVARGFGANGTVHSICQDDFGPAMAAIIDIIGDKLGTVCLPRPLVRDSQGLVGCDVVWELPPPGMAPSTTPTRCEELSFLRTPTTRTSATASRGAVCTVAQLAVVPDATAEGGMRAMPTVSDGVTFEQGWYYDDFSTELMKSCKQKQAITGLQRVAFTSLAAPPTGVTVKLECLNETQSLAQNRPDALANTRPPKIGDACGQSMNEGAAVDDDDACSVRLSAPNAQWPTGIDRSMFCHPEHKVCVLGCQTNANCPMAWVCDDRPATLASTSEPGVRANGSAFCVNPTCGAED